MTTKERAHAIRCPGCRRLIGWSASPEITGVWCTDPSCSCQPRPTTQEARDDAVFLLKHLGMTPTQLGELWGLTRQAIGKILGTRSIG